MCSSDLTNEQWSKSALGEWTSVNQLLWQSATTPYHIYAYAPYSATATDDGNITHTIAADQSQDGALLSSDLVGYTTKGTAAAEGTFIPGTSLVNGKLQLTLDHRLAQLTVNCKLGTALMSEGVEVASVSILYTPTTVNYNVANGIVSGTANAQPIIMASTTTANSYKAIVVPITIPSETPLVQIEMNNGSVVQYFTTSRVGFEQGKGYTLNLQVGKDVVELDGDIKVNDWESDESILPDGTFGETEHCYLYTGDMTDFPTNPSEIFSDTWIITLTNEYASLANLKTALTALNEGNRRIFLQINNLTNLPDRAFMECSSLASVSLPSAISIEDDAFSDCPSLASVSLPVATLIGFNAFGSCFSLASVFLPVATSIEAFAFSDCFSLVSVFLPVATSIGYNVFETCISLTTVELGTAATSAMTVGSNIFNNVSTTNIDLSLGTYETVTDGNQWNNYTFKSIKQE